MGARSHRSTIDPVSELSEGVTSALRTLQVRKMSAKTLDCGIATSKCRRPVKSFHDPAQSMVDRCHIQILIHGTE